MVVDASVADAGIPDAGEVAASCSDQTRNGDESDVDCGGSCTPCSLAAVCGTSLDCASGVCVSSHCSSPTVPCGAFAGCTNFTDLTAPSAIRTIQFPNGNDRYRPPCMVVRFGQSVTFQGGEFASHPLTQACGPLNSPLLEVSSGQMLTVTFDRALGTYGYYCRQHGSMTGSGMAGAIEVIR